MAAYFENKNFLGFASWMKLQAQEEMCHAVKFMDYLHLVGVKFSLDKIDAPPSDWDSFTKIFQLVYDHEVKVTESINNLVDMAISEKDHATNSFLLWFVNEQVEEVATADRILGRVKFIGENHNGLFFLDHELGKRA
jgi:ferritin